MASELPAVYTVVKTVRNGETPRALSGGQSGAADPPIRLAVSGRAARACWPR